MRDPDLVQRAERAAAALEKAWIHWRVRHGFGTAELPPVSSYVGYSLTEPWGQPRVVFGIDADEAERLAAILEGHDCVGPVHAEIASRPERWQQAEAASPPEPQPAGRAAAIQAVPTQPVPAQPMPAQPMPAQNVPAQPGTGAEAGPQAPLPPPLGPGPGARTDFPDLPTASGGPMSGLQPPRAQFSAAPGTGWPVPVARTEFPAAPATPGGPVPAFPPPPAQLAAAPTVPTTLMAPADLAVSGFDPVAEDMTAEQPILPLAMRQAAATADLPAGLPADAVAYLQDLATRSAARDVLPPSFPAAPVLPPSAAGQAPEPEVSHGPAEGRRRAQPLQQPGGDELADAQGQDQIARARLMPVSRLNHARRPPSPDGGPWPAGSASQAPTDTAV
jgi:hypothetical protein